MKQAVVIHDAHLGLPLAPIFAGRLSSHVVEIVRVPSDVASVVVVVKRPPDPSTTPPTPREDVAVAATSLGNGRYSVYFSPFCFPDCSEDLSYSVLGTDESNNPRWLGSGSLHVLPCPANGSPIVPPVIPPDTYIRNPVTGLYHKLVAEVDELGNITTAVEQEGIAR